VAKILVADDNSNIQKMVGLALKDQGIDVVAVGNGEAAVRKISDIKPDLVLADVFMPVRNGYEVCKYVKDDATLAHIPVILLVGAFDPLDEQEAQRVGADGVLKKPFVPPDPLISMVKSALARAGVAIGAAAQPPPPAKPEAEFKPLALHMPPPPAAPVIEEAPIEDIPVRPTPISIDRGAAQPLAFGSLLETPAAEEAEDDAAFVTPVRMERDWKTEDIEEEEEEEESEEPRASWRPGGTDLDENEVPAGKADWREAAFAGVPETAAKPAYITKEEETSAPELVAAEQKSSSAYPAEETWSAAVAKGVEEETRRVAEMQTPEPALVASTVPETVAAQQPAPANSNGSWMSVAPSPWDAEVAKASKLAATWDTSVAVAAEHPPVVADVVMHAAPETVVEHVPVSLPAATEEAIREEAAQVVEESVYVAEPLVEETPQSQAEPEAVKAPELNMDDMVAKILSKMDPSVLQAMTKELLKPVIESIVRDELNKK
jgi:CheY-like chemotaxis protein